jgi:hypothetical protein
METATKKKYEEARDATALTKLMATNDSLFETAAQLLSEKCEWNPSFTESAQMENATLLFSNVTAFFDEETVKLMALTKEDTNLQFVLQVARCLASAQTKTIEQVVKDNNGPPTRPTVRLSYEDALATVKRHAQQRGKESKKETTSEKPKKSKTLEDAATAATATVTPWDMDTEEGATAAPSTLSRKKKSKLNQKKKSDDKPADDKPPLALRIVTQFGGTHKPTLLIAEPGVAKHIEGGPLTSLAPVTDASKCNSTLLMYLRQQPMGLLEHEGDKFRLHTVEQNCIVCDTSRKRTSVTKDGAHRIPYSVRSILETGHFPLTHLDNIKTMECIAKHHRPGKL